MTQRARRGARLGPCRLRGSLLAWALGAAHVACVVSCTSGDDVLSQETTTGVPIIEVAGLSGQRTILILDPAQCFSCFTSLPAWLAWGIDSGRTTALLLTRPPNEVERRKMRLAGIREDGVLSGPVAAGTPMQILLSDHRPPRIVHTVTDSDAFRVIAEMNRDH